MSPLPCRAGKQCCKRLDTSLGHAAPRNLLLWRVSGKQPSIRRIARIKPQSIVAIKLLFCSAFPAHMADQTTANQTTIPPEVSAAIIEGFAEAVAPAVGYVVAVTAFGAMLIPILIALFCFSTKAIRHQPIFICNVASVLFGIFLAIYNDYVEVSTDRVHFANRTNEFTGVSAKCCSTATRAATSRCLDTLGGDVWIRAVALRACSCAASTRGLSSAAHYEAQTGRRLRLPRLREDRALRGSYYVLCEVHRAGSKHWKCCHYDE